MEKVLRIPLGRTGLKVSPVGFGCYRVTDRDPVHYEALKQALLAGCNLIDTSTNYTNGRSERLVGKVLRDLKLKDVVVVTKAGYVQGDNLDLARQRERDGKPFPDMVKYSDDCWHCISPEFLEDQLTRSLERLQLPKVDVLLLHNPEYFLKTDNDHAEYYERISRAFVYLETEVRKGRISFYGISSNTFPEPKENPDFTSLETVLELAERIGKDHHFAVIQFPFNLFEPGAALEHNNLGMTLAQLAAEKGLGTLINRPLNAFNENRLVRLADFPSHEGTELMGKVKDFLNQTLQLEARYQGKAIVAGNQVSWGHILRANLSQLMNLENWKGALTYQIQPALEAALSKLAKAEASAVRQWGTEYETATRSLFAAFTSLLESQAALESSKISRVLEDACPELKSSLTLSQKAVRLYLSIRGIDCILVGMRQPSYVLDALSLQPPLESEDEAIEALRAIQLLE